MKLTTFLFLVTFLQASAVGYAQKITLSLKNAPLKKVFAAIVMQTDVNIVYDETILQETSAVTIDVKDVPLQQVLDKCMKGQPVYYVIEKNTIRIRTRAKSSPASTDEITVDTAIHKIGVTGKVITTTGEAVPGVTVMVKGTTNGGTTNTDGTYILPGVPAGGVLVFSFVGMKTKEVAVANQARINVTLENEAIGLEGVVAIGYGVQRKADLTGAVANISADKLTTQSNANIGQALQGKIAGVDIVSQGGAPGAGSRIMIRGIGTLNNASPLYIVDGMYMGSIDQINPNDIQSIDVLKDASSAAIYGSRAANGVIIVTTKSGSNTDGQPIIEAGANYGIQTPAKYLDMLNATQWADLTTISRAAINKPVLEMAQNIDQKENNDWQRMMMGSAAMQNYNLTIRGGSKYFTYYTGLGYLGQDGVVKGTNYKRYNAQIKLEYKRGWFTLGNNVVLSTQQNNPLFSFARGGYLGIILQSIPSLARYDATNEGGGYGKVYGDAVDLPNPLGILDEGLTKRTWNNYSAFINLYAEMKLPFGLKYRFNATPDFGMSRATDYQNAYDFGLTSKNISSLSDDRTTNTNLLLENLLSYDKTLGKHKVSALLGYSYQNYRTRYIMASGKGMPDGIQEVGAATQDRLNNAWSEESALTSVISRLFYSYDYRYLITLTYRRDGSSKFARNNRYGNFPSVSVGWNVAEEQFMKGVSWLDQFKIRGGYGVLGNQEIANYMYSSVVTTNINYPNGAGGIINGAFPKDFANPFIKWEETAMTNVGVDLSFLKNKISFTADWYNKNTKDILLTVPIPVSTGGANDPVRNAGKIKNTGVEVTLGWNEVAASKDISYGVTLTGNAMKNEVIAMGDANQVINGGANRTNVATTKTLAAYPIGGFWLIHTQGLFQSQGEVDAYRNKDGNLVQPNAKPGDIKFKDANNDGKITDDDREYCGSPFPTLTMGLNANFAYKGLDILLGLQGVFGNKIYNATRLELEGVNKGSNFLASTLDYWREDNKGASHPRLVWDDPNQNSRPQSDRYLEDGSFFRVRNIQVGYTIPSHLFKDKIQKVRVYANVENLFTITKYSGYTPDINSGDATSRGFDNFVFPVNRVFMIGLNLGF
ncbi:TonB-dependent receptor [Chitinophaga sp. MM2321]|uniref:TonB-dependent receptor n=1 Tax=Chitinophaga sp. MM2321 TaxID=3137178 RepID=UPI0032D57451